MYCILTCTSYDRCSSTKITSTCQSNWTWDKTPWAYSSANQGCYSCPAAWCCPVTSHNNECKCYTTSSATGPSTCHAGYFLCIDWSWSYSLLTFQYSSCTQYCPASWGCPKTVAWWTCKTYNSDVDLKCEENHNVVSSTCQSDWTWSTTPWSYSSCRFPNSCSAYKWCSYTSAWGWCRTYKNNYSNSCDSTSNYVDSRCWDWTFTPAPYTYSGCTTPPSGCSAQWWCSAGGHNSTCTSYSSSSEYYNRCDRVQINSTCNDWYWIPTPGDYSSCTNISWGPNTWGGGSTGNTISYTWTYMGTWCTATSAQTTSCTPWASCTDSGKTCCKSGGLYSCK